MKYAVLVSLGLVLGLAAGGCPSPTENGTPSEVAAPAFTPTVGRFSVPQDVQVTCSTADATIYYTTDGTEPSLDHGTVYTGPIHLEASTTFKAIAVIDGNTSEVTSADFVRQHLLAVAVDGSGSVTPEPGLYDEGTAIQLQATPAGGWQFDHWEGHASGTQAGTTLTLDSDLSVKACFQSADPNLVLIDALIVGNGALLINPTGTPVGTGYAYPSGTSVRLTAVPANGWLFSGWYTTTDLLVSLNTEMDVVLAADTYFIALFEDVTPPPLPVPVDCIVIAQNGQALGVISTNTFDMNSLANPYGTYGNRFGMNSIWNRYGTYGSAYATYSPYSEYTSTPPMIFEGDTFIAFLTKNTWKTPHIDPDDLAVALGRYDVLRN